MKTYIRLIVTGFCFFSIGMRAQDIQPIQIDSIQNADALFTFSDTSRSDSTLRLEEKSVHLAVDTMTFKPVPMRAVLFSAIVPGLGQIYNKKYWKLPLVYGSFIGCTYALTWNNTQYTGYKKAFVDFSADPENTTSWEAYKPPSYPADINTWSDQQKMQFGSRLQAQKDYYRYYRDMSVIITVGVYALWMIDAYVDAQLFDFDISPDLSMRATPVLFEKTSVSSRTLGLQLCFTF